MKQPYERIKEIRETYTFEELCDFCEKSGANVDEIKESHTNGSKKQKNLDFNFLIGFSARLERTVNTTIEKTLKKDEKNSI